MGFGMREYSVDNETEHALRNSLFILPGIALLLFALIIFVKEFVLVEGSSRFEYVKHNWKDAILEKKMISKISAIDAIFRKRKENINFRLKQNRKQQIIGELRKNNNRKGKLIDK